MSKNDVFEGSTLKIRAKLFREGRRETGTARLVMLRDGEEISSKTLSVRKHWIEEPYTLPDVPDHKTSYLFSWRLEHPTGVSGIDTAIRVWPRTCRVKLTRPDGAPAARQPFHLRFDDGHRADFEADDQGECACTLARRTNFEVRTPATTPILEFKPGKEVGRQREAVVSPWSAEIYAPEPPTERPAKQYVNLTPDDFGEGLGHDGVGPEIAFVVGPRGLKDATSRDPAGVREIFVQVKLSDLTRRTSELATVLRASELTRVSATEIKARVPVRPDGCARFVLRLGRGGGEKCEIKVGLTEACAEDTRSFINWRKIWLEPVTAAGANVEVDAAIDALKTVFVEAVKTATTTVTASSIPGATIPGAELGLPQANVLIVGDHNEKRFRPQIANEHPGLTAYTFFCDLQIDAGKAESFVEKQVSAEASDRTTIDGRDVVGWTFKAKEFSGFKPHKHLLLPRSLHTGNPSVTAEWRDASGTWHPFPVGNVSVRPTASNPKGVIDLEYPPLLVEALKTGNRSLRVRFCKVSDTFNGWAPNKTTGVVIALGHLTGPRDAEGYQKTIVHEIGHQMNQLDDTVPAGLDRNDHGRYYTGRGHSGGHCADGIDGGVFSGPDDLEGRTDCGCVMYGEGADERPITFCARCKPFVLAEPLGRLG